MNFEIWGVTGSLHTQHEYQMAFAEDRLWYYINAFDASCNRFRRDSEISRLNEHVGEPVAISATLELALDAALRASDLTGGLCDPTVLPALLALGYDRDYDEIKTGLSKPLGAPVLPLGSAAIHLDREHHSVTLDPGCQIDLGSSAKALIADLVASDVAPTGGVVVEFGGDISLRGEGPDGPWAIGVSDSLLVTGNEPRITFASGGIATSSVATRTWRVGSRDVHHIIDPRTGTFAQTQFATATVTAEDCVTANAFATAALLWGEEAGYYIAQAGWSGRLVRHDGTVEYVGGWPLDEGATR